MIPLILLVFGILTLWAGAVMADVAVGAKHMEAFERIACVAAAATGLFVGIELCIGAWRAK
jgi:hypothetical protein